LLNFKSRKIYLKEGDFKVERGVLYYDRISYIALLIILFSTMSFLVNPWGWINILNFFVTCFGVGYIVNKFREVEGAKGAGGVGKVKGVGNELEEGK
jgi:hypothetical protein